MLEWVLSLMGTRCQRESTSPLNHPERVIIPLVGLLLLPELEQAL
jgi:hypothetical protein